MSDVPRVVLDRTVLPDRVNCPHGQYEGVTEGRIIRATVTGPLNLEMIVAFSERAKALYYALPRDCKVGSLTVFRESMMFTHDAVARFRETVVHLNELLKGGMVVVHVVAPDVEGRDLMSMHLARTIYAPLGLPYRMFESTELAEQWLSEQMRIV